MWVVWVKCSYILRHLDTCTPLSGPVWIGLFYYFMGMVLLSADTFLHHIFILCPWKQEEGIRSLRTGVTESCGHHVGAGNWILLLLKSSFQCFSNCWPNSPSPRSKHWGLQNLYHFEFALSSPCWLFEIWALSSFCCMFCLPVACFLRGLVMVMYSYTSGTITSEQILPFINRLGHDALSLQ